MTNKRVAIVTGGSSGLGKCIVRAIEPYYDAVVNWHQDNVDLRFEKDIRNATHNVVDVHGPVDTLINCAGVNHIEWLPKMDIADWERVVNTNARSIFLTAKHLCDHMKGGTILNIVSNAATIPMTTSIAYNASKAAARIMTKQMARELGKTHNITVFSISPNKLFGTGMSEYIDQKVCELRGWTPEQANSYQLAGLPSGKETDPKILAELIAFLLSTKERHEYLQGCDLTLGGPN